MSQRISGIISVTANNQAYDAKGDFVYNIGSPKRDTIIGSDGVHGFKETPQVPYIEGEFTDRGSLSLVDLTTLENATIKIGLSNGKIFVLSEAWFASEGEVSTGEGNIKVRFEGKSAQEV